VILRWPVPHRCRVRSAGREFMFTAKFFPCAKARRSVGHNHITKIADFRYTFLRSDCSSERADAMSTYLTFGPDLGIFARQLRQLGINIAWVGSPSMVVTSGVRLAGPALYGSYAVSDFAADSCPAAEDFANKYERPPTISIRTAMGSAATTSSKTRTARSSSSSISMSTTRKNARRAKTG
jgi:hypothetical protein